MCIDIAFWCTLAERQAVRYLGTIPCHSKHSFRAMMEALLQAAVLVSPIGHRVLLQLNEHLQAVPQHFSVKLADFNRCDKCFFILACVLTVGVVILLLFSKVECRHARKGLMASRVARVNPARSPWRAHAAFVPRLRQRQSFSVTQLSQIEIGRIITPTLWLVIIWCVDATKGVLNCFSSCNAVNV